MSRTRPVHNRTRRHPTGSARNQSNLRSALEGYEAPMNGSVVPAMGNYRSPRAPQRPGLAEAAAEASRFLPERGMRRRGSQPGHASPTRPHRPEESRRSAPRTQPKSLFSPALGLVLRPVQCCIRVRCCKAGVHKHSKTAAVQR